MMVRTSAGAMGLGNVEGGWIKLQRWVGVRLAAGQSREPGCSGGSSLQRLACWPPRVWLKTNDVQPVTMAMM